MGPEGAVNIIFRRELAASDNPDAERQRLVEDYRHTFANPFKVAELGYIDQVIMPEDTRAVLCSTLELLENKRANNPPKKHGCIPL